MNQDLNTEANKSLIYFTKHLEKLRQYKQISKTTKESFKMISSDIDLNDLDCLEELVDLSSLITISHLDLIASNKALYNCKSDWEKIFFVKNIYLTIYETLVTYKKYQKFLFDYTLVNSPDLKPELNELVAEIKKFKKEYKYSSHIELVRNNISGHISKDFQLYYDTIREFDGEKTAQMSIAFFKIIQLLQNFSTKLLTSKKVDEKMILETKQRMLAKLQELKDLYKKYITNDLIKS